MRESAKHGLSAREVIHLLGLLPLDFEGGYYRETWKSAEVVEGSRPLGTAIYYFLTDNPWSCSRMHKLSAAELWHFYYGDPVELLLLYPEGGGELRILGTDLAAGQRPQVTVPAHTWQGARLVPGPASATGYALMGTTMSPGFLTNDFTPGARDDLTNRYPAFARLILELT